MLLQAALDMGTAKRAMLEWTLSDICRERTDVSRALPRMQDAYSSAAHHSLAFHKLLLAELHAGIQQVCSHTLDKAPNMIQNGIASAILSAAEATHREEAHAATCCEACDCRCMNAPQPQQCISQHAKRQLAHRCYDPVEVAGVSL